MRRVQALLLCNEVHDAAPAGASESSLVICTAAVAHYNRGLLAWEQHATLATQMENEELDEALTHAAKVCKCLHLFPVPKLCLLNCG